MNTRTDPLEAFIRSLLKGIGVFLRQVRHGILRLKSKPALVGLGISILVAAVFYFGKDKAFSLEIHLFLQWTIWIMGLAAPVWYLYLLGGKRNKEQEQYKQLFAEIQFQGKDKKYPYLLWTKEEGKKEILCFQSSISLATWRNRKGDLETALDKRIVSIEQAGSKRRVKLVTIDTDYSLPVRLEWDDGYIQDGDGQIVLGENELGPVVVDLNSTPHMLSAGETGSGKSVMLRCISWQLLKKGNMMFFLDFKGGVEFGRKYREHGPVVVDEKKALHLLELLEEEHTRRMELLVQHEAKNIVEYYNKTGEMLTRIGVMIDEIAEVMDCTGSSKEEKALLAQMEGIFATLARQSRATGINMLIGVQRPDHKILPGQIKNNIPIRVCGRFADKAPSEIVLGNTMAQYLPNVKGRFMCRLGADTEEIQAYYFDDSMLGEIDKSPPTILVPELLEFHRNGRQDRYKKPVPEPVPPKKEAPPVPEEQPAIPTLDLNF